MSILNIGNTNTQGTIAYNIATELADNNAGNISARDVRQNLLDLAESIIPNVSSGDFLAANPFVKNVRIKLNDNINQRANTGCIVLESGIIFDNGVGDSSVTQVVAYPGPEGISHNDLADLSVGHPHTQYVPTSGGIFNGNIGISGGYWLNSRGLNIQNRLGIKFSVVDSDEELMHVGSGTAIKFDKDGSTMSSALGVAKAWINFSATAQTQLELDNPAYITVNNAYNISAIERVEENNSGQRGKFKIYFTNGLFDNAGDYVAIGLSNARNSNASPTDFDINTVGIVDRAVNHVTFYVLDRDANYIDAEINDLIVFGSASGVTNNASSVVKRIGPA